MSSRFGIDSLWKPQSYCQNGPRRLSNSTRAGVPAPPTQAPGSVARPLSDGHIGGVTRSGKCQHLKRVNETMRKLSIWARRGHLAPLAGLILAMGCGASAPPAQEPAPAVAPAATQPTALAPAAALDTVRAGEFDNGKMWTFEYPPLEYFRSTYGFTPDSAWFERARLGALRLQGCSASFVSPNGLVLTNHHCARGSVSQVSTEGESLLDNGFYARSVGDERLAEGATADQLIRISDVTSEVLTALEGLSDEEMGAALESTSEAISARIAAEHGGADENIVVEIISLWDGAKYSAYVFKRYTDLRLVMAPELQIGFFGGDPDNFTYPRYNLDMSFYRIYDKDGNPLSTKNYFSWSRTGVEENSAVFVIGNPGSTSRLQTMSELEFRRKVQDKIILDFISSRAEILQQYYDENPEEAEAQDLRNQIFGLLNSQKAYRGMWEGLGNPEYMARRRDTEQQFRQAIEKDPALKAEYGGLIDRMAEIQRQKLELGSDFGAFIAFGSPSFTSAVMQRAFLAHLFIAQRDAGAPEAATSQMKERLLAVGNQPASLQRALLVARLEDFEQHLGAESEIGRKVLQGRAPAAAADAILANSVLADSARAAAALESGALTMEDPAVQAVDAFIGRLRSYQASFQSLGQQQNAVASRLGRAHFDVYGTTIPPDATFSLRIADGIVKGYEYNGTLAPPYTTFYGLYDRFYSFGPNGEWALPNRWLSPPANFDLATPLNFVLTADVIGGNSGSPVINTDLQVVGLIFDGNIESLPGDYIYDPVRNRSVAVDVRGMLEALDDIYDADRLVLELTSGQLVPTEEEADAVRAGR